MLIIGSQNLDTILPLRRLPNEGENLTLLKNPIVDVPGGKGCNQAIACSKLLTPSSKRRKVAFLGQNGNCEGAKKLTRTLEQHDVEVLHCGTCNESPTGRGYIFRQESDGKVSAVVSGGSNMYGWKEWETYWLKYEETGDTAEEGNEDENTINEQYLDELLLLNQNDGIKCVLLQREIPEYVNLVIARHAKKKSANDVIILQDVGGEDRPMSEEMISLCDYIIPNQSELKRLVTRFTKDDNDDSKDTNNRTVQEQAVEWARLLQKHGANNVLVTLGRNGSVFVGKENGKVIYQKAFSVPSKYRVIDETGAGDCYRAAFAVSLSKVEGSGNGNGNGCGKCADVFIRACMKFASAAGALAVTKEGAVPSIPSRDEVSEFMNDMSDDDENDVLSSSNSKTTFITTRGGKKYDEIKYNSSRGGEKDFPYMFGSRLNSMKDRPDLWSNSLDNVREWVKRQGTIKGLGCVDFNYPQHFHTWTNSEAKAALKEAGLVAGAVCLRYPSKFARGAMNHPDQEMRREAIKLTMEAADTAIDLGCHEVVVWSACK